MDKAIASHSSMEKLLEKIAAFRADSPADGFDLKGAVTVIEGMKSKVESLRNGIAGGRHQALKTAVATLLEATNAVATRGEREYRDSMKQHGSKLAAKANEVKQLLEQVKPAVPETASGQSPDMDASLSKGQSAVDKCLEMTSLYVALTLYRNPAVRAKNKAAKVHKDKMASCLRGLGDGTNTTSSLFPDLVKEMNDFLKEDVAAE